MSIGHRDLSTVPAETVRVAQIAFPKGNKYLRLRDRLGELYQDRDFAELYSHLGQSGEAPGLLALVTILQYLENLSDRQAAEQVRGRIDWKYLLGLELTDPGFDFSLLSEFRDRLIEQSAEAKLLELLLTRFQDEGWLKAGGKQRTDSTHVLAAIRHLNRLELVGESMRYALNSLATVMPDWVQANVPLDWFERYQGRMEMFRLPKGKTARQELAATIGQDGFDLCELLAQTNVPDWVRQLPAVEALRQIWLQQYQLKTDQVAWREAGNVPPGGLMIQSPYDLEVRQSEKGRTNWRGYKVHLTESCDDDRPHLITHLETTLATEPDCNSTDTIHQHLQRKQLLPAQHLLDQGYPDAEHLVKAEQDYHLELIAPVATDRSWQARAQTGYDSSAFDIDWRQQRVTCPHGKVSRTWSNVQAASGYRSIFIRFAKSDCAACPTRQLCTHRPSGPRQMKLRPQAQFLALQAARQRQQTAEFKQLYQQRAGIEGTISQAVRVSALRQARYIGLAKTHLQQICVAAALNLSRLADWLSGIQPTQSRVSKFAALAPPLST